MLEESGRRTDRRMDTGESLKEGLGCPSTEDRRGEGKAEEVFMAKNVFLLFPIQPRERSQAPARDRHARANSRVLLCRPAPPCPSPSHATGFTPCTISSVQQYSLHSVPHHGCLQGRGMPGKGVPMQTGDWDTTKLLLFPSSPGKGLGAHRAGQEPDAPAFPTG